MRSLPLLSAPVSKRQDETPNRKHRQDIQKGLQCGARCKNATTESQECRKSEDGDQDREQQSDLVIGTNEKISSSNIEVEVQYRPQEANGANAENREVHQTALRWLGERPGSGDGEREASMTRRMPYEPLPASVFFGVLEVLRVGVTRHSGCGVGHGEHQMWQIRRQATKRRYRRCPKSAPRFREPRDELDLHLEPCREVRKISPEET